MAQLTIDLSGRKGLGKRYFGDRPFSASKPNHRYLNDAGQFAEGIYNPFAMYGYLSPANNTTKAITGTTGFLLTSALVNSARIYDNTTDSIFFSDEAVEGTQGKVVNLDTTIDTSLDATYTVPQGGGGTDDYKIEDMILYQVNGSRKIFFSTKNIDSSGAVNTGDVGIAGDDFGSPDPDWGSAVHSLTGYRNGRISFVLADNGFLYVLDANAIHKIDGGPTGGTNGTVTENALVFIGRRGSVNVSGTVIRDGIDLRGKMWVGLDIHGSYSTLLDLPATYDENFPLLFGVYVWDRKTTVANMNDFIPIHGIRDLKSMHIFQGRPSCFTESVDGYTQFRVWDGNRFSVVRTLGKNAFPKWRKHSVHSADDYLMWLGADGYIYMYGSIEGEPNALHIIGDMTAHVTTNETYSESGVFVAANNTESTTSGFNTIPEAFYVSFSDTGGNHLKKWYPYAYAPNDTAQSPHQGNIYTSVQYLPNLSTVKDLIIYCAPTANSATDTIATIKVYFNQSSTASITKTITEAEASRGYITMDLNKPYVHAVQVEIEYNTSQNLGTDTFLPSVGILEYEPTKTHSPTND